MRRSACGGAAQRSFEMPRVVVFGGSGKAGEYISCELVRFVCVARSRSVLSEGPRARAAFFLSSARVWLCVVVEGVRSSGGGPSLAG